MPERPPARRPAPRPLPPAPPGALPPPPPHARSGRKVAVALRYDAEAGDEAPRVVARGEGIVAERLLATAEEAGVPVREDAALASLLAAIDLDALVPPELYAALAEVLAWAYRQDTALGPGGARSAAMH